MTKGDSLSGEMASVKWTIAVFLTAFLITHVEGNDRPQDQFVEGVRGPCGGEGCPLVYFDSSYEECCGGVVYRKDFDDIGERLTKCCQFVLTPRGSLGVMYSTETHECCNYSIIIDKSTQGCCGTSGSYDLATHGCCGGQIYDMEEQICCGDNELHNIAAGDSCCGIVPYHSKMSTCCEGEVKQGTGECCGHDIYQTNEDICCQSIEGSVVHTPDNHDFSSGAVQCCGINTYRPADQLCCNLVVYTRHSASQQCCGNSTYDENEEICCQGRVSERGTANGCCGPHPFNEDNQVCCNNVVENFVGHASCCDDVAYNREISTCVNPYGFDGFVEVNVPEIPEITQFFYLGENQTAYLSTEKFECGGQLHDYSEGVTSCCGYGITFDSSKQLCCNSNMWSVVVTKTSSNAMCCGERSFNPETEGCCDESKPFDLATQKCCPDSRVMGVDENCDSLPECQVRRGNDKFCPINDTNFGEERFVPYNSETAVCTPSGVRALLPGLAYCGDEAYKTTEEICCQNKLVNKFEKNMERECCETYSPRKYYIPEIETCYNGRIFQIPRNVSRTCSGHVYDSRYYGCDVAGHIRRKEEIAEKPDVCFNQNGPFYFNKLHHSCCSGQLIAAGHKCCDVSSECCQPNQRQGYNTETHMCCDGNLVTKEEGHECCGTQTYDSRDSTKLCCLNKLYENYNGNVRCEGETITGRLAENQIICRGNVYEGYNIECCGAEKYDPENEICCRDVKYSKASDDYTCCGSVAYDSSDDKLCCGGSLYEDPEDSHECCGNVTYDTVSETCCTTGGSKFVTSAEGQCCSNDEEFDKSLHTCCGGLIHNYIANGECCENHVIRDPSRELCCGGRFVRHYGDKRCCSGRVISSNEMCNGEN